MNVAAMTVMPSPTARRAASITRRTMSTPTQTSIWRGKMELAITSIFTGTQAPATMLTAISVPSMPQPSTPRGRLLPVTG